MRNMRKRCLAMLMAVMMLVSLLPVSAFAEAEPVEEPVVEETEVASTENSAVETVEPTEPKESEETTKVPEEPTEVPEETEEVRRVNKAPAKDGVENPAGTPCRIIGVGSYQSLNAAIEAAKGLEKPITITMDGDCAENVAVPIGVTVYFGSYSYTGTATAIEEPGKIAVLNHIGQGYSWYQISVFEAVAVDSNGTYYTEQMLNEIQAIEVQEGESLVITLLQDCTSTITLPEGVLLKSEGFVCSGGVNAYGGEIAQEKGNYYVKPYLAWSDNSEQSYTDIQEAINAEAESGGTISLQHNYTGEGVFTLPENVTLCVGDYIFTGTVKDKSGKVIQKNENGEYVVGAAGGVEFEGEGTEAFPYLIGTLEQLNALASAVNGGEYFEGTYFKLTGNIGSESEPFTTPIGNAYAPFGGIFNGDGYSVYLNITTNDNDANACAGLFGYLGWSAEVYNVTTKGFVTGTGTKNFGGICGYANSALVCNCVNEAVIAGTNSTEFGGIIGCYYLSYTNAYISLYSSPLYNCINVAPIVADEASNSYDGIVGDYQGESDYPLCVPANNHSVYYTVTGEGTVTASYSSGTVTVCPVPGEGNQVKSVTSADVTIGDGYTFTMPEYDVSVTVEFEEAAAPAVVVDTPSTEKVNQIVNGAGASEQPLSVEDKTKVAEQVDNLVNNTEVTKVETKIEKAVNEEKILANEKAKNANVDSATATDKQIKIKLDSVKVETKTEQATSVTLNTAEYDVTPWATITTTVNGEEQPPVTRQLTNDEIESGVTVRLAVPATEATMAKVTHTSTGYDDEVFLVNVQGEAPNQYVEIVLTHFSTVTVETLDEVTEGTVAVIQNADGKYTGYETLDEAVADLQDGQTLEIVKANTYTMPSLPANVTVKGVDGVVIDGRSQRVNNPDGCTFENITFLFGKEEGGYGETNGNYTTKGFSYNTNVTFNNCTFKGQVYTNAETFICNSCTFENRGAGYPLYVYGSNLVKLNNCVFDVDGKAVKVAKDGDTTEVKVIATGCEFKSQSVNKNAFMLDTRYCPATVIVNNCTFDENFQSTNCERTKEISDAVPSAVWDEYYEMTKAGKYTDTTHPVAYPSATLVGTNIVLDENNNFASGNFGGDFAEIAFTEVNGANGESLVVPEGYQITEPDESGNYSVEEVPSYAAQVGEDKYSTFNEALNAAIKNSNDVTLTLLADAELDTAYTVGAITGSFTIDLNGQTLTIPENTTLTFRRLNSSITDSSDGKTGKLVNNGMIDCNPVNAKSFTLDLSELAKTAFVRGTAGSLKIAKGTVAFASDWSNIEECVIANKIFCTTNSTSNSPRRVKLGSTVYDCTVVGVGTQANPGTWVPVVATCNSTNYDSLAAAIAAAGEGDTVNLCGDSSENITISKALTINIASGVNFTGTLTPGAGITCVSAGVNGQWRYEKLDPVFSATVGGETKNYATLADAIAAVDEGGTITVLKNAEIEAATFNGTADTYVLDMDGKTLTFSFVGLTTADSLITVPTGKTLTVKDGTLDACELSNVNNASPVKAVIFTNNGTLNLNTVTVNGHKCTVNNEQGGQDDLADSASKNALIRNYGTLTVTGSTIENDLNFATDAYSDGSYAVKLFTGSSAAIIGGSVIGHEAVKIESDATLNLSITNLPDVNSVDNAGSIVVDMTGADASKYTVIDYTGTGTMALENYGTVTLTNGNGEYVAKVVDNDLVLVKAVAQIGTTGYATVAEAIADAKIGDTIKLLADLSDLGSVNLPAGVTLDGNSHKISGNSAVYVNAAGGTVQNVVFENIHNTALPNASDITKYDLPSDKVGTLSAIYAEGLTGTATITGCTFDSVDWDAIQIVPTDTAVIAITDNTFKHTNTETSQVRYVHIESPDYIDATLNVTDNKFYDTEATNPINNLGVYKIRKAPNVKLSGNWFETISNVDTTYPEMIYPAHSQTDVDVDDICPAAMKVVGTPKVFYGTLQEAFDACVDIQLVKNTDENATIPSAFNKQIQANEFRINSTITNNGSLYLMTSVSDEVCTGTVINNGSLKLNSNAGWLGLKVTNNGKLEILGTGDGVCDLSTITNNDGGVVQITGGRYTTAPNSAWIAFGYAAVEQEDGTFLVEKHTFADDAEALAAGAVAKSTKSGVTTYYNTLSGNTGSSTYPLTLLKNVEEDVVRTSALGLNTNGYKFKGSIDAGSNGVTIQGNAELSNVKCKNLTLNRENTSATATVIVIEDCTVSGSLSVGYTLDATIEKGSLSNKIEVASGGKLTLQDVKSATSATQLTVKDGATLVITGGMYKYLNVEKLTPYVATGYKVVELAEGDEGYADGYNYKVAAPTDFVEDEHGVWHIKNEAGWAEFAAAVNDGNDFNGKKVVLDDDLDFSTAENADFFAPVGAWVAEWVQYEEDWGDYDYTKNAFNGEFDGQNKSVDLALTLSEYSESAALFGVVGENGTVKNLTTTGSVTDTAGSYGFAAICAENYGTLENCYNTADVIGAEDASQFGGVCAYNKGTIKNCTNTGAITGAVGCEEFGGICGKNEWGNIESCTNTGAITGAAGCNCFGGVAGYNGWTVIDCSNSGTVTGAGCIWYGPICGYNYSKFVKTVDDKTVTTYLVNELDASDLDEEVVESIAWNTAVSSVGLTDAGIRAILTAAGVNAQTELDIVVDVKVTVKEYFTSDTYKVAKYELTPYASVYTPDHDPNTANGVYNNEYQGGTLVEDNIEVNNEWIDLAQPIFATIYTGFTPEKIEHTSTDRATETFTGDAMGLGLNTDCSEDAYTVVINHFSELTAIYGTAPVATVSDGETTNYFATIDAAIEAAESGDTLTVLGDCALTSDKTFPCDVVFNGDLALTGSKVTAAANLTVNGGVSMDYSSSIVSDGKVTINDAVIVDMTGATGSEYTLIYSEEYWGVNKFGPHIENGYTISNDGANNLKATAPDPIASVTVNGETTNYTDLHEALEAGKAAGSVVTLLNHVDLKNEPWTPVTDFNGTFDGNNMIIRNLKVEGTSGNLGLFANVNEATIKNLTVAGASITGSGNNAGVIAGGGFRSKFENVAVMGYDDGSLTVVNVDGAYVGGIVGGTYSTITDSKVISCSITGKDQVGGVIGYICGASITGCEVEYSTVTATSERAGVLAGKINVGDTSIMKFNDNTVKDSSATAPDMAGGIAAQIMGKIAGYEIKNNTINVTLSAPATNPIGVLRDEQNEAFTAALGDNITGNWWENATLNADSYQYTNVASGVDAQTIYRGAAVTDGKAYRFVSFAEAAMVDNSTMLLLVDSNDNIVLPAGASFNTNGKTYGGNVTTVEGYIVKEESGVYTSVKYVLTIKAKNDADKTAAINDLIEGKSFTEAMQAFKTYADQNPGSYVTAHNGSSGSPLLGIELKGNVKLTDDIALPVNDASTMSIFIYEDTTIDLNGHTLSQTPGTGVSGYALFNVKNGAKLTIIDTSTDGDGKLSATLEAIENYGTVELNGGTIALDAPVSAADSTKSVIAIYNVSGEVELTGGKIEAPTKRTDKDGNEYEMGGFIAYGQPVEIPEGSTLVLGEGYIIEDDITGIQFATVEDGMMLYDYGDGTLAVTEIVATVEGKNFAFFDDAVEEANGTKTITLLKDVADPYTLAVDETLIIAKNGHKITVNAPEGYALISSTASGVITYSCEAATWKITKADGTVSYNKNIGTIANGATYELLKDASVPRLALGSVSTKTMNVTLDLGGHTLTSTNTSTTQGAIFFHSGVKTSGSLTMKNGTFVVNDGLTAIALRNNTNAILEDNLTINTSVGAVLVEGNAKLNTAATINSTGNCAAIQTNGSTTTADAEVNVTGGSISSAEVGIYLPAGELNITGGEITGTTGVYVKSGEVNISGGKLIATGAAAEYTPNPNGCNSTGDALVVENCDYPGGVPDVSITGGEFTSAHGLQVGAYYNAEKVTEIADVTSTNTSLTAPEGYKWDDSGKLVKKTYVAQIGDTKYETLQAALTAAAAATDSAKTVTLLNDVTENVSFSMADKNVILDLNGKTLTGDVTVSTAASSKLLLTVKNGTVTGNVAVTNCKMDVAADATVNGNINYNNVNECQIKGTVNGNVTVNGTSADGVKITNTAKVTGTVTANSGTVKVLSNNSTGKKAEVGSITVAEGATATITGGVFTSDPTDALAPEYCAVQNSENKYEVIKAVAKIATRGYATLEAAIEAAKTDDTVTLLADCAENIVETLTASITIDGNGKTMTGALKLTGNGSNDLTVKGFKFQTNGLDIKSFDDVTVQNNEFKNITGSNRYTFEDAMVVDTVKNATITDNTVNGADEVGIDCRDISGELEIKNNTVQNTKHNSIQIVQADAKAMPTSATVTGNTLENWGTGGEGRALRGEVSNLTFTGNVMKNDNAPEQFVKLTTTATTAQIDVSQNYWNGGDPSGNIGESQTAYYIGVSSDPYNELKSYYTDEALDNLLEYVAQNFQTKKLYAELDKALSEAKPGETVNLLKDLTGDKKVSDVVVVPNVTLDLNGFDLEARLVVAFGLVKNSSSTGKLITEADHFGYFGDGKEMAASTDNVMPVWVGDGYVFYAVASIGKEWKYGIGDTEHNPKYRFQPHGADIAKVLAENSGVKVYVEFTYTKTTTNEQGVEQTHDYHLVVEFGRTFIAQFLGDTTNTVMYVSLLGTENVSSISARTYLISEKSNFSIASDWISTPTGN